MAGRIASGAYTVVSTGAGAVATGAGYAASGASYVIDKADDGVFYATGKLKGQKQLRPAPIKDNYTADIQKARQQIQKIRDLYTQRNDAAR